MQSEVRVWRNGCKKIWIFQNFYLIKSFKTKMAEEYIAWDPNPVTKKQVQAMVDGKDEKALDAAFTGRIAFGTAGLRGPMAPGYTCMNDLVILQTVQGLCAYLKSQGCAGGKVVIGYALSSPYNLLIRVARLSHKVPEVSNAHTHIFLCRPNHLSP